MNLILSIPIELRLLLVFLFGTGAGGQLNRGIYRLAWDRRSIGPWSPALPEVSDRHWSDRIPVMGWWRLRREATWHGSGYWIRPMLIELTFGFGLAALYWWEVVRGGLWLSIADVETLGASVTHCQFLSHAILLGLMTVATFIDFDEQTIPDEITLTGTVLALALAFALPQSLLPTSAATRVPSERAAHMVLTSSTADRDWLDGLGGPVSWPSALNGRQGLAFALLGIGGWCFAITHKTWTLRRGWLRAVSYLLASIRRRGTWRLPTALAVLLGVLVLVGWWGNEQALPWRWQSLLSALFGMCAGGGLIWAVRIIAGHALQAEAMGFGDVTLMAMIGAFVGWQAACLVFFLAPLTALLIAIAQRILTGDRRIAFGPYLCLAAVLLIVFWDALWVHWALPMFSLGLFMPCLIAACLCLMGVLLWLWRLLRGALFGTV